MPDPAAGQHAPPGHGQPSGPGRGLPLPLLIAVTALVVVLAGAGIGWAVMNRLPAAVPPPSTPAPGPGTTKPPSAPPTTQAPKPPSTKPPGAASTAPVPTYKPSGGPVATTGGDLGKTLTSNGLELTLKSQQCGVSEIKGEYETRKAVGQYCVYELSAKNTSTKELTFSLAEVVVQSSSNRKYDVSLEGTLAVDDNDFVSEDLAPGSAGTALVVFDLSANDKPTTFIYEGVIVDMDAKDAPVQWQLP